jgi:hypothetical protein
MKNKCNVPLVRLFGVIALAAVIVFTMAACEGDDDSGGNNPQTVTYTGTSAGTTYILVITGDTAYVLTVGQKTSSGAVTNKTGGVLTLKPSNATATFTANVSGSSLTALDGTVTWTDDTTDNAPGELTGGGNNNGGSNMTWTAVADSTFESSSVINAIAYGNNKFVAVGYSYPPSGGYDVPHPGKMAYSSDGVTWTAVTDSTFGDTEINAITYASNKFVAGGQGGKMAYSSDGITWTAVADSKFVNIHGVRVDINAIAYGNNKFVAVGAWGKMVYSSDGVTWTAVSNSTFTSSRDYIMAIAYVSNGNAVNKFVAGGRNPDNQPIQMASSSDGITWTAVADSTLSSVYAIAYGNGTFVAGGGDGKMAYSADGVTWTAVADSKFDFLNQGTVLRLPVQAIAYGNNKVVAVGFPGKVVYSADGITWTAVADSKFGTTQINAIVYGNNKFVAVGQSGKMAYSTGN